MKPTISLLAALLFAAHITHSIAAAAGGLRQCGGGGDQREAGCACHGGSIPWDARPVAGDDWRNWPDHRRVLGGAVPSPRPAHRYDVARAPRRPDAEPRPRVVPGHVALGAGAEGDAGIPKLTLATISRSCSALTWEYVFSSNAP